MLFLKRLLSSKYFWGLIVLALVIWSLIPRQDNRSEIPVSREGMTLVGTALIGWEKQEINYKVVAREIWRSKDEKTLVIRGIEEAFFFKCADRQEEFSFTADWARIDNTKELMVIGGEITGWVDSGTFETEEAEVNMDSKDITVSSPLTFFKEELRIEAQRMEGNLDTENFLFTGDIKVYEKDYHLRGERLRYFGREGRFELEGELEVELEL